MYSFQFLVHKGNEVQKLQILPYKLLEKFNYRDFLRNGCYNLLHNRFSKCMSARIKDDFFPSLTLPRRPNVLLVLRRSGVHTAWFVHVAMAAQPVFSQSTVLLQYI